MGFLLETKCSLTCAYPFKHLYRRKMPFISMKIIELYISFMEIHIVMGQMTRTKSWGSEVEFIYACGPRGGSLQILGAGVRQKPAYTGRGWSSLLARECGAEHGAKREAGACRSRRRKLAWRLMAGQDFLKMEFSFPVTT